MAVDASRRRTVRFSRELVRELVSRRCKCRDSRNSQDCNGNQHLPALRDRRFTLCALLNRGAAGFDNGRARTTRLFAIAFQGDLVTWERSFSEAKALFLI
jgi:hypothetical protein